MIHYPTFQKFLSLVSRKAVWYACANYRHKFLATTLRHHPNCWLLAEFPASSRSTSSRLALYDTRGYRPTLIGDYASCEFDQSASVDSAPPRWPIRPTKRVDPVASSPLDIGGELAVYDAGSSTWWAHDFLSPARNLWLGTLTLIQP